MAIQTGGQDDPNDDGWASEEDAASGASSQEEEAAAPAGPPAPPDPEDEDPEDDGDGDWDPHQPDDRLPHPGPERRLVFEAWAERGAPSTFQLRHERVYSLNLRQLWKRPPRDALHGKEMGHSGTYGPIARSVAFHNEWPACVRACRRAILHEWGRAERRRGSGQSMPTLRIALICKAGKHRSVGAAYLLANTMASLHPAATTMVVQQSSVPCGCPEACRIHMEPEEQTMAVEALHQALQWTQTIVDAAQAEDVTQRD